MKKQNKIHVKRVVSLQDSTLVLGKSSGNVLHELTEKECVACGIDLAASPEDIAEHKDVEFTEIKINRKTADPPISRASHISPHDSMLLLLLDLFVDPGFTIQLLGVLLLSRFWSIFWPELVPRMQVHLTGLFVPSDPLLWMIRLIGGAESWKGNGWSAQLPTCLYACHSFGQATVASRWTDYTRTEIRLRNRTVQLRTRYVDRAVLILSSFPATLQRTFHEEQPFAIPLFSMSKTPTRTDVTLSLDGSISCTYEQTLFDHMKDCTDELMAECEAFVRTVHKKKRWRQALLDAFQQHCIISRDGNYVKCAADADRRIHAAMLAVLEIWFRWLIDTDRCAEETANERYMEVWAVILPETYPKPAGDSQGEFRVESLGTFLRFLNEQLATVRISDHFEQGSVAVVREVSSEKLLILHRELTVNTLLDWAKARQVDCTFIHGRKSSEIPAKLQRAWMTEAPDLFKTGGRDVTWKYSLVDAKHKVAALGLRLESLRQQLKEYQIPVDSALGQLVCPPETDAQPELTESAILEDFQEIEL
ncbi:MAG: hypothetical protein SO044_09510 [Agathobaculum sp.]|uniref:hypothetical protein n=1 Tax=Agathobaculum sp. TaxID=2048138 RepID=UPI002A80AA71|nr:hypothetical protein [Agathobaculum sp.]MDY3712632.1 hypothetical protein [Agathobaculum sp.]